MSGSAKLGLGLLLGAAIGAIGGMLVTSQPVASAHIPELPADASAVAEDGARPEVVAPAAGAAEPVVEREVVTREDEGLVSTALLDYSSDGLRAGWRAVRDDEMPEPEATAFFSNCHMTDILDDPMAKAASKPGVVFFGGSLARFPGGWENVPKKDMNDLFPDWKSRLEG